MVTLSPLMALTMVWMNPLLDCDAKGQWSSSRRDRRPSIHRRFRHAVPPLSPPPDQVPGFRRAVRVAYRNIRNLHKLDGLLLTLDRFPKLLNSPSATHTTHRCSVCTHAHIPWTF